VNIFFRSVLRFERKEVLFQLHILIVSICFRYALRRGGRVLFADEMGLGKTLQALATILYWRHEWPVLIVVPSSLRLQWADQVQQWIPNIVPTDINISTSQQTLPLYNHLSFYFNSSISSFSLSYSLTHSLTFTCISHEFQV
jgi:N12 class adenine-specific DNA methylase